MLEWIAEKLGLASVLPWPRASVALILGIISSLITWAVTDLPWSTIVLCLSVSLSLWTFLESIGNPITGFCVGLSAFWIGAGTNAVQKTVDKAQTVKCLYIDHDPIEACYGIEMQREKPNG